jgi:two-component system response regulator VicR
LQSHDFEHVAAATIPMWHAHRNFASSRLRLRFIPAPGVSDARDRELHMIGPLLVVDDNDDLRELLADALVTRGFMVWSAGNGRDAIDQIEARAARPAIVLLDLNMPVMDGAAFLQAAIVHPLFAHVPVVIMTAEREHRSTWPSVVRAVLAKPVKLDELLRVVERVSTERRAPSPVTLANGTGSLPEQALVPEPELLADPPVVAMAPTTEAVVDEAE